MASKTKVANAALGAILAGTVASAGTATIGGSEIYYESVGSGPANF